MFVKYYLLSHYVLVYLDQVSDSEDKGADDLTSSPTVQNKLDQVDEETHNDDNDAVMEDEIAEDIGINQLRLSYDDLKVFHLNNAITIS